MSSEPPPTYDDQVSSALPPDQSLAEPIINIIPTANSIGFQKGYLGADAERAAIEGELQVKGANGGRWGKVFVTAICIRIVCMLTSKGLCLGQYHYEL